MCTVHFSGVYFHRPKIVTVITNHLIVSKREVPRDVRNSKSGDKTSSGEIGLDIITHASHKVGQDQVSGGVRVPCRHATPVADALWKPIFREMSGSVC